MPTWDKPKRLRNIRVHGLDFEGCEAIFDGPVVTSGATRKKFPASRTEWEAVIAAAPGKDRPLTAAEEAKWANAVAVTKGGYPAVRSALAEKRKRGQRGPQHMPTKQLVSVRYSPEVLEYFKSTGTGWQTRMNDALRIWVAKRTAR